MNELKSQKKIQRANCCFFRVQARAWAFGHSLPASALPFSIAGLKKYWRGFLFLFIFCQP